MDQSFAHRAGRRADGLQRTLSGYRLREDSRTLRRMAQSSAVGAFRRRKTPHTEVFPGHGHPGPHARNRSFSGVAEETRLSRRRTCHRRSESRRQTVALDRSVSPVFSNRARRLAQGAVARAECWTAARHRRSCGLSRRRLLVTRRIAVLCRVPLRTRRGPRWPDRALRRRERPNRGALARTFASPQPLYRVVWCFFVLLFSLLWVGCFFWFFR